MNNSNDNTFALNCFQSIQAKLVQNLHKDIDARKNDQEFCKSVRRLKPQTRPFFEDSA
jgi:hypothetical protein